MRALIVLAMTAFLNACALTPTVNKDVSFEFGHYRLQPVPAQLVSRGILEQLDISRDGENHTVLVQTEMSQNSIEMVGLTPSGLELFNVSWSSAGWVSDYKIATLPIPAERMLAFFQFANWPQDAIEKGLSGLALSVSDDRKHRVFSDAQRSVFTLTLNGDNVRLEHDLYGFEINITTLETWDINE